MTTSSGSKGQPHNAAPSLALQTSCHVHSKMLCTVVDNQRTNDIVAAITSSNFS